MAATTSSKPRRPRTYAIVYGFISGPGHGRQLRDLLNAAGFTETQDILKADVLVTHSAGCHLIPAEATPKFVFLVGATLNSINASNWLLANYQNVRAYFQDRRVLLGIKLNLLHLLYAVTRPDHNQLVMQAVRNKQLPEPPKSQIIFIANRHDPWPVSADLETYVQTKPWAFISLPGPHENIWEMPDRYVAIIKHYV